MAPLIRVFRATARPGCERAFRDFLVGEAVSIIRRHDGLLSVQVGLPTEQTPREFLMVSTWRDLDALKGFTGEQWQQAYLDPREAPLVERAGVEHYAGEAPERAAPDASAQVTLRDVTRSDLPIFYRHQLDPVAVRMAAFTAEDPSDHEAFTAHWNRVLRHDGITKRTILLGREVAGHILAFERDGDPEVTYWIGREHWGKGVATRALTEFLDLVPRRPLYARAAKDNAGSIRVLEKCGFRITGEDRGFANARGEEIEEYVLALA